MSPIVIVFLMVVIGLAGLLALIAYLAFYLRGWRQRKIWFRVLGALPLMAAAVPVLWLVSCYWPVSSDTLARRMITLPPQAHVLSAWQDDFAGEGAEFNLPDSQSPEQWLDAIWKANPQFLEEQADPPAAFSSKRYSRNVEWGQCGRSLEYDPKTKTYSYSESCRDD